MSNSATTLIVANNTPRILQSTQTVLTTPVTQASASSNTWYQITGLSLSITPSSTTSKILLLGTVTIGTSTTTAGRAFMKIQNGGVDLTLGSGTGELDNLGVGSLTGSTNAQTSVVTIPILYMDSPATTSSITYDVFMASTVNAITLQCNSSGADTNSTSFIRFASNIIALEVQ